MVTFDVVVVGAGNAGLCAALAAREQSERVLVLE
ncbi:MAG: FAD-binding protein, partial [Chloroflexota bacterium]|nr:FAD-binding protein [Chloroflexota bacterium]